MGKGFARQETLQEPLSLGVFPKRVRGGEEALDLLGSSVYTCHIQCERTLMANPRKKPPFALMRSLSCPSGIILTIHTVFTYRKVLIERQSIHCAVSRGVRHAPGPSLLAGMALAASWRSY
jgi:hypothetical protein